MLARQLRERVELRVDIRGEAVRLEPALDLADHHLERLFLDQLRSDGAGSSMRAIEWACASVFPTSAKHVGSATSHWIGIRCRSARDHLPGSQTAGGSGSAAACAARRARRPADRSAARRREAEMTRSATSSARFWAIASRSSAARGACRRRAGRAGRSRGARAGRRASEARSRGVGSAW